MERIFEIPERITGEVIGAAIEVHRHLGPGLLESVYQHCLCHELELRGIPFEQQRSVSIQYKNLRFEESLRFDFLVAGQVIVEIKAVERVLPVHKAQLMSYMKILDINCGLLINFNVTILKDGVNRLINPPRSHSVSSRETFSAPPQ